MWRSVILCIAVAGCEWGGGSDANGLLRGIDARTSLDATTAHDAALPPVDGTLVDGSMIVDGSPPVDGPSGCAFSGVLASYAFAAQAGSQATTPAATTAPGLTAGGIARSASIAVASGAGSMNASTWPTTAQLDPAAYYALAIMPPPGCTLSVTGLAIDAKSSGTGPASAAVATSADGFAQTSPVSTAVPSTPTVTVTGATALEIRIFGYAATSSSGTMRLQNQLSITGSLQ